MLRLRYKHDVCLSVCLSVCLCVTLVIVIAWCNKTWKSADGRIGRCLGCLPAEADTYRSILWSRILLRKTSGAYGKIWSFAALRHFACRAISAYAELHVPTLISWCQHVRRASSVHKLLLFMGLLLVNYCFISFWQNYHVNSTSVKFDNQPKRIFIYFKQRRNVFSFRHLWVLHFVLCTCSLYR